MTLMHGPALPSSSKLPYAHCETVRRITTLIAMAPIVQCQQLLALVPQCCLAHGNLCVLQS